jgi:hypothetical protein
VKGKIWDIILQGHGMRNDEMNEEEFWHCIVVNEGMNAKVSCDLGHGTVRIKLGAFILHTSVVGFHPSTLTRMSTSPR